MSNEVAEIIKMREETTGNGASIIEVRNDEKRFPRLIQYEKGVAVHLLSAQIYKACVLIGREKKKDDILFIAQNLYSRLIDIRSEYAHLHTERVTFVEIQRAFENAIYGKEVYDTSVKFFYDAIVEYICNDIRKAKEEERRKREKNQGTSLDTIASIYATMMARANKEKIEQEKENK